MKFLADENLPRPIVRRLRQDGHEVTYVSETALGIPDAGVLAMVGEDQVVVTEDKDFGELVFRERLRTSGVLFIRLEGLSMSRRAAMVSAAVTELGEKLLRSFTVISRAGTRRQSLGDIDPGENPST